MDESVNSDQLGWARMDAEISICPLTTPEEFAGCVDLQRAAFGWADLEITPIRVFVVMREAGGLILGAFNHRQLVGFVNCTPATNGIHTHWQSQLMCVVPSFRDKGVATALKYAQRDHAIRRGVDTVVWAFDPLVTKNAYLYISKLGVIVRRYSANHYGPRIDGVHSGLETDRLIAEWRLQPRSTRMSEETLRIGVPANTHERGLVDFEGARAIQLSVRAQFIANLADGFVVVGCERHRSRVDYVFRKLL